MDKSYSRGMKLSAWARQMGVSYRTAWRWVRDGKLPDGVTSTRTKTGTILINVPIDPDERKAALFLLGTDDGEKLGVRDHEVLPWLKRKGYNNISIFVGTPSKLPSLIRTVKHQTIVVEAGITEPFGIALLRAALEASGRELLVYGESSRD